MNRAAAIASCGIRIASSVCFQPKPTIFYLPHKPSALATFCTTNCSNEKKKKKVIVIAGPTGSGKSRLALALAKKLKGEIISADSVQIYRGLDIGSAKPSLAHQREIPHHVIDVLPPFQEYSAGQFFEDARNAASGVLGKGKVPLVTGGTGLYLRWFIYGKPEAPKASLDAISEAFLELERFQKKGMWEEGVELVKNAGDPKAPTFPLNNWYRLRRSLEIIRSSGGHPPSAFLVPYDSFKEQIERSSSTISAKNLDFDFICLFLTSPRIDLYRAIDLRCEGMLWDAEGLLSEASWLLDIGLRPNMNSATRAIGYRQAMEFLLKCRSDEGRSTVDCFKALLFDFQKASRNFAKRQMTWFRNELIYHWIDASMPLESVADFVCQAYREQSEKLVVPKHLIMKKEANNLQENYELKSYRTENRIFRHESDCRHVLEWIWRTQGRDSKNYKTVLEN